MNSKYYFSTKTKVKKIIGISGILLVLVCVGLLLYTHFSSREENLYKKYLKGTNYEFLERFYDGQNGNKFTYTLKGIVYNVREINGDVNFDINGWDLDTRESLYFTNIEIPNLVTDENPLEKILYDFEPVNLKFVFEESNLISVNIEKLSFTEQEYNYVTKTLQNFLTNGYSSRVGESDYSDILPVNVMNKDGEISILPIYVNSDALYGLYGIGLLSSSVENNFDFNVDKYVTDSINRIKSESEKKGINDLKIPGNCTMMYKLKGLKIYDENQLDRLSEVFCNKDTYDSVFSNGDYANNFDELSSFVTSNTLDMDYEPKENFDGLMYLSDLYSFARIYEDNLDPIKVEKMENLVATSILSSSKNTETYNIPYKTLCSLSYSIKEIPDFNNVEKYSELLSKLGDNLNNYGDRQKLLESSEKDTRSALKCVFAFEDSSYADVKNLMESIFLKMYYIDIYSMADNRGNFYNGLWTKSTQEYPMLTVEDNVRYYNLLKEMYDKK